MSDRYYHFTALHLLPGILADGLTLGRVPWSDDGRTLGFREGLQWITTNGAWEQCWCNPDASTLDYRRDDVRLVVEIPSKHRARVLRWVRYSRGNRIAHALHDLAFGDEHHWRLYRGVVEPKWIKDIALRPPVQARMGKMGQIGKIGQMGQMGVGRC